jgi:hypothetical protein
LYKTTGMCRRGQPMQLTFDEATHTYRIGSTVIASVTQILKYMGLTPDYPAGPYRTRGKRIHEACCLVDNETIDQYEIGGDLIGYVESYRGVMATALSGVSWRHSEHRALDSKRMVAGTIDRAGSLDGRPVVADIKSGDTGPETALQTAAYTWMLFPQDLAARNVLRLKIRLFADGKPGKLTEYTNPLDLSGWDGLVNFYKWKVAQK